MAFGLNNKGFKRKPFLAIKEDIKARLRKEWRPDLNLSDRSKLGHIINAVAVSLDLIWQALEAVHYGFFIAYAKGATLVNAMRFRGISPHKADYAIGQVTLSPVAPGQVIPAGFLFKHQSGMIAQTTADAIGSIAGTADAPARALQKGPFGNFAPGSTFEAVSKNGGVKTVSNESDRSTNLYGVNKDQWVQIPNDGRTTYFMRIEGKGVGHGINLDTFRFNIKNETGAKEFYNISVVVLDSGTRKEIYRSTFHAYQLKDLEEQVAEIAGQRCNIVGHDFVDIAIVNDASSGGAISVALDNSDFYPQGSWYSDSVEASGKDLALEIVSTIDGQFSGGRNKETDTEGRARYMKVLHLGGSGRLPALQSEIWAKVHNLYDLKIKPNNDPATWAAWINEVVVDGKSPTATTVPAPGSLEIIAWGGQVQELIDAIGTGEGMGQPYVGNVTGFYTDQFGQVHQKKISNPTLEYLYVSLKPLKTGDFRPGMEERLADIVIRYIGGIDSNNIFWPGLGIERRVSHAALVDRLMNTRGLEDIEVKIGTSAGSVIEDHYDTPEYKVPMVRRENIAFV